MERKPLVIYHFPCLDGFTSAWVAWKEFGDEADYLPAGYADDPVIPDVDNRIVYILDYSYPEKHMREIAKRAETVIVLDHHLSAEKDLAPLLEEGIIEGEFDMDRSGAGMAWDWFNLGEPRPDFVNYVEDRDLWRKELPDCEQINIAMFSYDYTFENWETFDYPTSMAEQRPIERLRQEGKAIWRKHMKDVDELITQAMRLTIGGYDNIMTVNANYMFGSDLAGKMCIGKPFAAYFMMNANGEYVFGLRSEAGGPQEVDVSEIAKSYGGGGHKNASGFRVKSLEDL